MIAALQAGLLTHGGGHAMAAGFSVLEPQIPALRVFLNDRLRVNAGQARERALSIDGIVSLTGVNVALARMIEQAGPFGAGNSPVRIQIPRVKVVNASIVGDGHVRAILVEAAAGPSQGLKAMAFRSASTPLGQALLNARGKVLHVAGQLRVNVWQGRESVDFFIDDVAWA